MPRNDVLAQSSRMRRRILASTATLAVVVGMVLAGCGSSDTTTADRGASDNAVLAVQPLDATAVPSSACIADPMCLRQYYQALTWQDGPAAALAALDAHAASNQELTRQCHDTTHAIGEVAALVAPMTTAMALGSEDCGSGYYHGIIATMTVKVEPDRLAAFLNDQCGRGPQTFERWECFHGVGHGFVFASNGDIFQGISVCESISNENDLGACASGAFMQELVDHGNDDTYQADPYRVCRAMPNPAIAGQCYDMHANIVMVWRKGDRERFAECTSIPTQHAPDCYRGLGRARFAGMPFTGVEIEAFCGAAGSGENLCLEGAIVNTAAYYGSSAEAATHCTELTRPATQELCRKTLAEANL